MSRTVRSRRLPSRRLFVIVLLLGLVPVLLPAQTDSAIVTELELFLTSKDAAEEFSGVILVARGDRVIVQRAFGMADRSRDIPNRVGTKFRIASMTKMFTGVAVSQLAQAGKLRYGDTVAALLPSLKAPWTGTVTVSQLLTHTSGLGSIWTGEFASNPRRYRTVPDYLPIVEKQSLQFEPGTSWGYSNAGFIVLGAIIEKVTGRDYRAVIRDSIFAKAGMSTADDDDVERTIPARAIPYTRGGFLDLSFVPAEAQGLWTMMPAGGAVLSAGDVLKFAKALTGHTLLNEAFTDSCVKGKVRYRATASYGYGIANEYVGTDTVVFHDGGADGISANMDIFPKRNIVAIILSNFDTPAVNPYRDKIRELVTR